jgi:hypothetical protein
MLQEFTTLARRVAEVPHPFRTVTVTPYQYFLSRDRMVSKVAISYARPQDHMIAILMIGARIKNYRIRITLLICAVCIVQESTT